MHASSTIPAPARWLGFGGLIPFIMLVVAVLLAAHQLADMLMARHRELPAWYLHLRTPLSFGAVASLVIVGGFL